MRLVLSLLLLFFDIHSTSADTHSLKYLYTTVSGDIDLPKFTAVGLVDDEEFIYFDSNIKEAVPKTEWIRQNAGEDYWNTETERLLHLHQIFNSSILTAMERFNQNKSTRDVHTLQRMYGCEWDDETEVLKRGFDEYGYDGKNLISPDVENIRYFHQAPEASRSKQKWDSDREKLEHEKHDFTYNCVYWLKEYVRYGRRIPGRTVSPEVSLLHKDPCPLVKCHATGFYPRQVMIYWQKNGEDLYEDVAARETVPNGDGTFQKSHVLLVKSEEWKNNPDVYTCVVQHKSGEDIKKNLTEGKIKTNPGSNDVTKIIAAVAAALVFIIIAIVVFCLRKRSKNGGEKKKDSGSSCSVVLDVSEKPMLKDSGSSCSVVLDVSEKPVLKDSPCHTGSVESFDSDGSGTPMLKQ